MKGIDLVAGGLVGRAVTSVVFIHDYIQLVFDGPLLSFLADPVVIVDGSSRSRGSDGYCDELCGFIGKIVESISLADERFEIVFSGHGSLYVPLFTDHCPSTNETVIFQADATKLAVF